MLELQLVVLDVGGAVVLDVVDEGFQEERGADRGGRGADLAGCGWGSRVRKWPPRAPIPGEAGESSFGVVLVGGRAVRQDKITPEAPSGATSTRPGGRAKILEVGTRYGGFCAQAHGSKNTLAKTRGLRRSVFSIPALGAFYSGNEHLLGSKTHPSAVQ